MYLSNAMLTTFEHAKGCRHTKSRQMRKRHLPQKNV